MEVEGGDRRSEDAERCHLQAVPVVSGAGLSEGGMAALGGMGGCGGAGGKGGEASLAGGASSESLEKAEDGGLNGDSADEDLELGLALSLSLSEAEDAQVRKLRGLLGVYGVGLARCPKDGNCQFHSIADGEGAGVSAATLREDAVEYLAAHTDHFRPFVHGERYENYLIRMSLDGSWGDHLTLLACATVRKLPIQVLSASEGGELVIVEPLRVPRAEWKPPILVIFEREHHYSVGVVGDPTPVAGDSLTEVGEDTLLSIESLDLTERGGTTEAQLAPDTAPRTRRKLPPSFATTRCSETPVASQTPATQQGDGSIVPCHGGDWGAIFRPAAGQPVTSDDEAELPDHSGTAEAVAIEALVPEGSAAMAAELLVPESLAAAAAEPRVPGILAAAAAEPLVPESLAAAACCSENIAKGNTAPPPK